MKKGIKRTICILLTAISCISLAGCGEVAVGQADINPQANVAVVIDMPQIRLIIGGQTLAEGQTLMRVEHKRE